MRAAAILTCLLLAGCGGGRKETDKPPAKKTAERAPETYRVLLDTSKGPVVIAVTRTWAPRGADRFYQLVESGFYDGARFFRVVRNFVAQFGLSGRPEIDRLWSSMRFPDDAVQQSNKKGYASFAFCKTMELLEEARERLGRLRGRRNS